MTKLLKNGNIASQYGVYDPETHFHTLRPVEITPDDRDYRLSIPLLPESQKQRAKAIYLAKNPEYIGEVNTKY